MAYHLAEHAASLFFCGTGRRGSMAGAGKVVN